MSKSLPSLPAAFAALLAFGSGAPARAVEVTFTLTEVATLSCPYDPAFDSWECESDFVPVALSPAQPAGTGATLDFDASGGLIRGALNLEAFTAGGAAIPAWADSVESDVGVSVAFGAPGAWPLAPDDVSSDLRTTRFVDQTDFDGTFELMFWTSRVYGLPDDGYVRVRFAFQSVPGAGPPLCPGETLLRDDDGDGEVNARDAFSLGLDTTFGGGVDDDGRTIAEFCRSEELRCAFADFRNDEPQRKRPRDCGVVSSRSSRAECKPRSFVPAGSPAPAARFCDGHPLLDDADADGEPDGTDRCPGTAAGAAIDGAGCSLPQFCSAQSRATCRRADFRNDQPGLGRPGDCVRAQSAPRDCVPAQ